jgi:hypothetical protein
LTRMRVLDGNSRSFGNFGLSRRCTLSEPLLEDARGTLPSQSSEIRPLAVDSVQILEEY